MPFEFAAEGAPNTVLVIQVIVLAVSFVQCLPVLFNCQAFVASPGT